jgi:alpha-tubulin suppressor-like RCC1 family protein
MPTFYSFYDEGVEYSFDDIFVPADLFRDGNLWIWGISNNGDLGNATIIDASTPVTTFAGGSNWKQISAGTELNAAIKTDGTLWTWGSGANGRLGNADTTTRSTPVTTFAGGSDWKQISSGNAHIAAIKTDGTLWIWGTGANGRLGNGVTTGNISTPVTTFAGGTNWKSVFIGGVMSSAIKTDGTLWTWGGNNFGRLGTNDTTDRSTPVTTFLGGNNWKQVDSGGHIAAVKTDGTLWCWGAGSYGRLGNADTTNRSTPVTTFLGGTDWKSVSTDNFKTTAIKNDGTLWSWGRGDYGQTGNADTLHKSTPVTTFAGGTNWKQVNCGNSHVIALKTDGTIWTWGRLLGGVLGNGVNTAGIGISTPVTTFLGGSNWKSVSASGNSSVALTYDDPVL